MFQSARRRRAKWRYFLGLSVLGLMIIASAAHATIPAPEGVTRAADCR